MVGYHPPAPGHKKFIFMDHQKKEAPNSVVQKIAETNPNIALTRALLSPGGGAVVSHASKSYTASTMNGVNSQL